VYKRAGVVSRRVEIKEVGNDKVRQRSDFHEGGGITPRINSWGTEVPKHPNHNTPFQSRFPKRYQAGEPGKKEGGIAKHNGTLTLFTVALTTD